MQKTLIQIKGNDTIRGLFVTFTGNEHRILQAMTTETIEQPFEVRLIEASEWKQTVHNHNFFEIVSIIEGKGLHIINGIPFDYRRDNLFVLNPDDHHEFEIGEPTKFLYIRFTKMYLKASGTAIITINHHWAQKIEYMLINNACKGGCILQDESDISFTNSLIECIVREISNKKSFGEEIIMQSVVLLLQVVIRNMEIKTELSRSVSKQKKLILEIIHYLQQNIYQPELLSVDNLANVFHLSSVYVSEYFKKHTGGSLKKFITEYRITLVKNRLLTSDLQINEIAYELGFNNDAYLIRLFREQTGVTPAAFRKNHLYAAELSSEKSSE